MAICVYCNASIRLTPGPAGQPEAATLAAEELPAGVVERGKQLIAAGQRAEAVALYQQHANVDAASAEAAVDRLVQLTIFRLTRQMPLNWLGTLTGAVPSLVSAAGAAWAAAAALAAGGLAWQWLLALVLAALSVFWLAGYLRRLRSNLVTALGPRAHAAIVRLGIISTTFRAGGTLVTVEIDARPEDGRPPFRDQETMLVRNESMPKLQPGQVIQVRYDPMARDRVFPISPIKAWDDRAGAFV